VLLAFAGLVLYFMLRASLPQLDGDVAGSAVKAPA
jgi:hypothetical protein